MLRRRTAWLVVAIGLLGIVPPGLAAKKVFQPGIDPTTGKPLEASRASKPGFPVIRKGTPDDESSTGPDARLAARPPAYGSLQVLPKSRSQSTTNPAAAVAGGIRKLGRAVFGRITPGSYALGDGAEPGSSARQANPRYRPPVSTESRAGSILSGPRAEKPATVERPEDAAKRQTTPPGKPDRASAAATERPASGAKRAATAPASTGATSRAKSGAAPPKTTETASVEENAAVGAAKSDTPGRSAAAAAAGDLGSGKPAATARSPMPKATAAQPTADTPPPAETKAESGLSKLASPARLPLHERLSLLRRSLFDKGSPAADGGSAGAAGRLKIDQEPSVAPREAAVAPRYGGPATPEAEQGAPAVGGSHVVEPGSLRTRRSTEPVASEPATAASGSSSSGSGERVLCDSRGPALSVRTIGPQRIAVGKESVYQVQVQNAGQEGAEEVVVSVELPPWAEVVGTQPSFGTTESAPNRSGASPLLWRIAHLEAGAQERLLLRIVPRESKPFDLAVRWDYRATASQTMIEVQEPRLEASIDGPREVLYGKSEIFKLTVANTGNGPAEEVIVSLLPLGSGNQPVSQNLGTIVAGEEKVLEVELTARQVGDLEIRVQVRGDGGLHADLIEQVMVRRAALAVEVDGPEVQYVGTDAGYRIRVGNPGTAPAANVALVASLPAGSKYLGGVDGGRVEANGTKVAWTLPALLAGEHRDFMLRCTLGLPGDSHLEVLSTADGDLTAVGGATTRVEAIADLVLEVKDPGGPVPVGSEATYELIVRNRGTKDAEGVQVKAFFSHGIEPVRAEGAGHRLGPGQVIFSPIARVPAGGELALAVQARAETSGNHIFRAEVHCQALGTRLVSEETTHYYIDAPDSAATTGAPTQPPDPQPVGGAGARQLPSRVSVGH